MMRGDIFGAAVMSSLVWKCYDVSRNNENVAFCLVRADPGITAQCTHTAPRAPELVAAALVSAWVYTGLAAACF